MNTSKIEKAEDTAARVFRNWLISLLVLCVACLICSAINNLSSSDMYVPMVFVLAVLVISLLTDGYFYGVLASLVSVLGVNYAFTYPYMKLDFSAYGYPTTFITMLAVSLVISTLTTRVREQEKLRHETAQAQLRANMLRAISHDLRTPLTSIIGSIDTVICEEEHLDSGTRAELLSDAKKDAEWLVRMVENLLSITRISGAEETVISKSPELIEEIIGECVLNFKKRHPDVNLNVRVPEEPLTVDVDAMLIEQVLMNLMDNAVYHSETMTELCIEASAGEGFACISVSDDGVGLDPDIIPELFKGQICSSKGQPFDGNKFRGIGLAVCSAIISAHGGSIKASNRPTGGAVFEFTIPMEVSPK